MTGLPIIAPIGALPPHKLPRIFVLDFDSSDSITNNTHFHPWVVLLEVCVNGDKSNGMVKGGNGTMRLFSSLSFPIPSLCDLWRSSCSFPF